MISKEQIRNLLGSGLKPEEVSSAVGCEPSYISQLLSDEEFAATVVSLRVKHLQAHTTRDLKIDELEDTLLEQLSEDIRHGMLIKPRDKLAAFSVINSAKRRGTQGIQSMTQQNVTVVLQLPQQTQKNFTLNAHAEVIEVEGQTLVTMPTSSLLKGLAQAKGPEGGRNYEKLSRYLPTSVEASQGAVEQLSREGQDR